MSRDRIRREADAAWRLNSQDLRSKSTVKELRVHMELERKRSAVRSGFSHVQTPELGADRRRQELRQGVR